LANLDYIDIADNTYTGTIPDQLVNLPNLQFFYLDNCDFATPLTLEFVTRMPAIFENWMDFTQFTGGIPTEIGTVSTLASWSLTFCGLTGTIPTELGNLAVTLDRLWLYQNQLVGTIPTELGNLARMQFLYFEGNQLSGSMPAEICALRSPAALLAVSSSAHNNYNTSSIVLFHH
jgi:Leucine-rich repeat (LRR) protein